MFIVNGKLKIIISVSLLLIIPTLLSCAGSSLQATLASSQTVERKGRREQGSNVQFKSLVYHTNKRKKDEKRKTKNL